MRAEAIRDIAYLVKRTKLADADGELPAAILSATQIEMVIASAIDRGQEIGLKIADIRQSEIEAAQVRKLREDRLNFLHRNKGDFLSIMFATIGLSILANEFTHANAVMIFLALVLIGIAWFVFKGKSGDGTTK